MLIELGRINYKLLIPLIYPIFYQIRLIIHKDSNPFYIIFTNYLGYLFSGLIYILIKCRMKKKHNSSDIEKENLKISEIIYESEKDNRKSKINKDKAILDNYNQIYAAKKKLDRNTFIKKYLYILLLSFINLVPMFLEAITLVKIKININFKIGSSLFYYIIFFII